MLGWMLALGSLMPQESAATRTGASVDHAQSYAEQIAPFLQAYCVECHGPPRPKGELDLTKAPDLAGFRSLATATLEFHRLLLQRDMPPPGAAAPPETERQAVIEWLAAERLHARPGHDPVGEVVMRRLSHDEYDRTVRDLLGLHLDVSAGFPADDLAHGFDNLGVGRSTSALHIEKYMEAAERLAAAAVITEDPSRPPVRRAFSDEMQTSLRPSTRGDGWRVLYTSGDLSVHWPLPREGEYEIRVRAYGEQAGPDLVRMAVLAGGRNLQHFEVRAVASAPETYVWRGTLPAGQTSIAAAFLNDYFKPQTREPSQRDRNLAVQWIELVGPLDPPRWTDSHRLVFAGDPLLDTPFPRAEDPRVAVRAEEVLRPLTTRAWRRPPREDELAHLIAFVTEQYLGGESFESAVHLCLQALLVSPRFLFRIESHANSNADRELDSWELASRLSYFLWSSMPDERLFERARRDELRDPEVLAAEARRMLRDPRSVALAENFASQWLELRSLDRHEPDASRFPGVDRALLHSMRRETERLFESVLFEQRPVRTLLEADFSWLDERLARHYGIDGVSGPERRRVHLRDDRRRGLLGHASILTLTSNPTRTSPVKRGKWILEQLLASPPPPPPPDAGSLDESASAVQSASLRERLEQHRRDPSCASCHTRMDALGFALENFDAVGRWREHDGAFPIDSQAELPDGRAVNGPQELRVILADDKAFSTTLLSKLLVYALGRGLDDEPAIAALEQRLANPGTTLHDMILGIVSLDAFRRRSLGSSTVSEASPPRPQSPADTAGAN